MKMKAKDEIRKKELNLFTPFDKQEFIAKLKKGVIQMRVVKDFGLKKEVAIKLYKRFTDTALFRRFLCK